MEHNGMWTTVDTETIFTAIRTAITTFKLKRNDNAIVNKMQVKKRSEKVMTEKELKEWTEEKRA